MPHSSLAEIMPSDVRIAPRRFSVDEYYRMAEVGILSSKDRVELLQGEVVEMSPIGVRHAACVDFLAACFMVRLGDRAHVRVQGPVRLDGLSEPEPDVAVLKRRPDGYTTAHPRPEDVLLIVEVAQASVEKDRSVKLPLYASAGIPEVWIVNLIDGAVEVFRDPDKSGYTMSEVAVRGHEIAPAAFPDVRLVVGDPDSAHLLHHAPVAG